MKNCMRKITLDEQTITDLYWNKGLSLREISSILGHDLKTVLRNFKEKGVGRRNLFSAWEIRNRKRFSIRKEWVEEQYLFEGRTIESMAKEIGIRRGTFVKHMRRMGLSTKNPREAVIGRKKSEQHKRHISLGRKIMLKRSPGLIRSLRAHRLRQVLPVKDTLPERLLEEELARREFGHYKQYPILGACQADKAFPEKKIAVFCDGDYWHRRPDVMEKDARINKKLESAGWIVLRFWEHEIKADPREVVDRIEKMLN
ncbi:MAG: DUF559 domain-containing protein [Candidatus Micrarchaeota archaeon]